MSLPGESHLVLIHLPAAEAAEAVRRAWDREEAVTVVDPGASRARLASLVEALQPTWVVGQQGRQRQPGGRPLAGSVAAVVSTSGTTAEPRRVVLTRDAMAASARAVTSALGSAPKADRWLACVPLHYVAGLAIVARSHFCETPMTVHSGFDVGTVGASAGDPGQGCTLVSLVPTMLARLLEAGAPIERFRRILLGGAPVAPSLLQRASRAGATVTTTYGLTETGGGCVHQGEPLEGVSISLSAAGEILVRGEVVMWGYHRDPWTTQRAFTPDGWLRTGDLGSIDAGGRLLVTDRIKDIIITGGVNVSPASVERVLGDHPLVRDVCVVGVPDDEWGELVVACVVQHPGERRPTLSDLRSYASQRLAPSELPRQLRYIEEVPRSSGGKAQRRQLRATLP